MKKQKTNKGITLIALIITIIVLLILAGITLNMLFGESGILKNAQLAANKTEQAQIIEEIELAIMEIKIEKIDEWKLTKEKLAEYLTEKLEGLIINEITEEEIKLEYKGYEFIIDKDDRVILVGKAGIYITYKLEPEGYTTIPEITITLSIQTAEGISIASITPETEGIETIEEGVKYKVTANGTYVLKIVDNSGNERKVTIPIQKIDTEGPRAQIEMLTELNYINAKVKAKITLIDEQSGVDLTNCKWVINEESGEIGTESTLYTGGELTNEIQEIETENITAQGSYYIHVLGTDKLGNVKETISEVIEVKNAYMISTPEDFQNMKNDLTGAYYVVKDIDMKDYPFTSIDGWFSGSIDGQGHTISNLTITSTDSDNYGFGIFRRIGGSGKVTTISNLILKDVNISSVSYHVGVFAGYAGDDHGLGDVKFTKVGISGDVKGYMNVGGFVGTHHAWDSVSFEDCYSRVNLTSTGGYSAGGFACIGSDDSTFSLNNSYWSGTINTTKRVSSFITYSSPDNNDNMSIIGNVTVENCYYDKTKFPVSINTTTSGTGLTTEQMQTQSNYEGWDFENTWYMEEDGYPELKFE